MEEFEITLRRLVFGKEYTEGWFMMPWNGTFITLGDSLEDRVRDFNKDGDLGEAGEEKVYGKTAIPFGRHKVVASWSNRFKEVRPEVIVNDFSGIRIHWGRTAANSEGCPLAGHRSGDGELDNDSTAKRINDLFMKAISEGKHCYLNVI